MTTESKAVPDGLRDTIRSIVEDALNSAIPEPWEVADHAADRILAAAQDKIAALTGAVTEIAESDDTENALDPQRNKRIAQAALAHSASTTGCTCRGCGRRYGADLIVPDDVWARIAKPAEELLCASCIMERIVAAGIWTAAAGIWTAARACDIDVAALASAPVAGHDLRARCVELLEWWSTGILRSDARLRVLAREKFDHFGDESIWQAEMATFRELVRLYAHPVAAPSAEVTEDMLERAWAEAEHRCGWSGAIPDWFRNAFTAALGKREG